MKPAAPRTSQPRTLLALVLLVLAQTVAVSAFAQCLPPFSCVCMPSRVVVQGTVVAPGVAHIEAIDNFEGVALDLAVGATATLANLDGYAVGDRFLGTRGESGSVRALVHIDADERITVLCSYAPKVRPTVVQVRSAMASTPCGAQLMALFGIAEQTCNDAVGTNVGGCSAGPGARGSGAWLGLAFLVGCTAGSAKRRRIGSP